MNQEKIWQELTELPADAQQMVADFVGFLHTKYAPSISRNQTRTPLQDEPFVGMWREREDMSDSTRWVRQLRTDGWGPSGG